MIIIKKVKLAKIFNVDISHLSNWSSRHGFPRCIGKSGYDSDQVKEWLNEQIQTKKQELDKLKSTLYAVENIEDIAETS
ncbi:MAG: hypothetical protein E6Q83_19770 [Thiothrix sp.]|nr:MAG: hypothetical protein E6Q83_19770 [Thiothrix sp.]